jgi:hypothetical protein
VLIRIGPATPVAPVWMCAMLTTVLAGKPCIVTVKFTTAAVIAPEASRVMLKSIVAAPLPEFSELLIGGVSCAGNKLAVNRVVVVPA